MINHWMFKCKDISHLISQSMDKKLSLKYRMGIKIHLMMCDLCARYKDQLLLINRALAKVDTFDQSPDALITPLPDHAKNRIRKALESP
jgi:hypothetical protein